MTKPLTRLHIRETAPSRPDALQRAARLAMALAIAIATTSAEGGSVFKGKDLYQAHCAICHGANGRPVMPGAPHFERSQGLVKPDPVLFDMISTGKRAMPGYRGVLKHEDIMDVIAYLRTLH